MVVLKQLCFLIGVLSAMGFALSWAKVESDEAISSERCEPVLASLDVQVASSEDEALFQEELFEACDRLQTSSVSPWACAAMAFAWRLLSLVRVLSDEVRSAELKACGGLGECINQNECSRSILGESIQWAYDLFTHEVRTVFHKMDDNADWLSEQVKSFGAELVDQVDGNTASHLALFAQGSWACGAYAPLTKRLCRLLAAGLMNFTCILRSHFQAAVLLLPRDDSDTEQYLAARVQAIKQDWPALYRAAFSDRPDQNALLHRDFEELSHAAKLDSQHRMDLVQRCLMLDADHLNLLPESSRAPAWVGNSNVWGHLKMGATVEDGLDQSGGAAAVAEEIALVVGFSQERNQTGILASPKQSLAEHALHLVKQRPSFHWRRGSEAVTDGPRQKLQLYVHAVPACAGEELLARVAQAGADATDWRRVLAQTARHLSAVHHALLQTANIVTTAAEASLFYIPAFFKILIELYAGGGELEHLNCIVGTWEGLDQNVLLERGGYDHILVGSYGTMCEAMECDAGRYHPAFHNMISLVAGDPAYGHPDNLLFRPGGVWPWLQRVFVPYGTSILDCVDLDNAIAAPRDVAVALFCSANSRVRRFFQEAMADPKLEFQSNERVQVHVLEDTESVFGAMASEDLWKLYRRSVWCLIPPGNLHDLTYRFYDAIRFGCLPVIVASPPLVASVPFAARLDYPSFAHFAHVDSTSAAAEILRRLLDEAGESDGADQVEDNLADSVAVKHQAALAARREALRRQAPKLFYEHTRCEDDSSNAGQALMEELVVRHDALLHLSLTGVAPTL